MPSSSRPFISICIPTYNSGTKLENLLDSVRIQTFTDYEIVITDDSPNESVSEIVHSKYADMNIRYVHNPVSLGTPANWNRAVAEARGEWIKIMHHDDWFLHERSLELFANQTDPDHSSKLIFCAFKNINTDNNTSTVSSCSAFELALLRKDHRNLYKNFIGNPSCTLLSSRLKPFEFDTRIKWLIDFDFYTWYFRRESAFRYINEPLIAFRIHTGQVTAQSISNPEVEIPESSLLFEKYGVGLLKNVFAYDFFWRMFRNLKFNEPSEVNKYLNGRTLFPEVERMTKHQFLVPRSLLHVGIVSKACMFFSYLINRFSRSKS